MKSLEAQYSESDVNEGISPSFSSAPKENSKKSLPDVASRQNDGKNDNIIKRINNIYDS